MVANKTLIFKKVPTHLPVAGEHLVIEDRPIDLDAAPPAGGLLVEGLYASFDPYLRGKMRDPSVKSYSPPFALDGPISNNSIGRVLKSDRDDVQEGDVVRALFPIAEYATIGAGVKVQKIQNPHDLDLALFLGPLGMPGLTAYSSFYRIGKPKKGETIFVSSAAGAVGQLVGQIAKHDGLRVIGSVGSDEKLGFILNELGFDAGFNYKKESPFDALPRLAPEGIDIYYENVGGEHLDAALANMNPWGRIPVSGMISGYNTPQDQRYGVKGLFNIISKRLLLEGFIVGDKDFGPAYEQEHHDRVSAWLADGSFKATLAMTSGIENAAEGLIGVYEGKNFGKAVLKLK